MMELKTPPIDAQAWAALVARNVQMDLQMLSKRKSARYDVAFGHVTVYFREEPRPHFSATLLQVSLEGLMLRTFERIPRGTVVALHIFVGDDECVVHAESMHSTDTVSGYKIGFRLQFSDAPTPAAKNPAGGAAPIPAAAPDPPRQRSRISEFFRGPRR